MLSAEELHNGSQRLTEEIKAIQAQPTAKKVVRYRTPVSKPVEAEELHVRVPQGPGHLHRHRRAHSGGQEWHERQGARSCARTWEVSDVVGPVGPYQLRYTLERDARFLTRCRPGRCRIVSAIGLSAWYVEPVTELRGETLEQALKPGSEFRQIVDGLDPQYAVVTFWVYPDSFPLYRQLRDYLYEHELVVAGRPLPEGATIASTRHGTVSRGQ